MKRVLLTTIAFLGLAVVAAAADASSTSAAVPEKAAVCPSLTSAA